VLDISRYSVLTGNEALSQYTGLLSDLVTKDTDFKMKLVSSAQSIEESFLDRGVNEMS